jgi:trehalose/maltose transport system substrate-binding protein
MSLKILIAGMLASVTLVGASNAASLAIVSGDTGTGLQFLQSELDLFKAESGHDVTIVPMPSSTSDQFGQYRLWLAAGNADIDVYQTDVIWAPQLADQLVDLTAAAKDVVGVHFPSVIESQTVNGKLVAVPGFTDAPALFYRKDLLEKHGKSVPSTWVELRQTAQEIMDAERAEGNKDMWGYVFQANAYEGLTCNALEWVNAYGGGQIIEADGTISINNEQAVAALEEAASWIGTIAPQGVLAYGEEEARGVWQLGNSVFMRNWPYAYALSNSADAPVKDKFDVAPLPAGDGPGAKASGTLGGWNFAVSKYSKEVDAATELALFLASEASQKRRAIGQNNLPTVQSLYQDADVLAAAPFMAAWEEIFKNAVPRPSAPTQAAYNEASSLFWSAVHNTLSGNGSAAENLEVLEIDLTDLLGK